jgi:hypothetical protein
MKSILTLDILLSGVFLSRSSSSSDSSSSSSNGTANLLLLVISLGVCQSRMVIWWFANRILLFWRFFYSSRIGKRKQSESQVGARLLSFVI